MVQCCSSAICECGFSARTKIKTKWRNRMEIESLDNLLRIAIEIWDQMDFSKAMELWKSKANRHLLPEEEWKVLRLDATLKYVSIVES